MKIVSPALRFTWLTLLVQAVALDTLSVGKDATTTWDGTGATLSSLAPE